MYRQEEHLVDVTAGLENNPADRIGSFEHINAELNEQEKATLLEMSLIEGEWEHTHVLPEDTMNINKPYDFSQKQVGETFVKNIVNRQVPGYNEMRRTNAALIKELIVSQYHANIENGEEDKPIVIFDSGCSNGATIFDTLSALSHSFGKPGEPHPSLNHVHYTGVDSSQAMIDNANKTMDDIFRPLFDKIGHHLNGNLNFVLGDVMETEKEYANLNADITTSVLMTMFMPVHHRTYYYDGLYAATKENGHLIVTEKVIYEDSEYANLFSRLYHIDKFRNGLSRQAIENKHLSLKQFLHPMPSDTNESMMKRCGFADRELFWKNFIFESHISRKVPRHF